MEHLFTCHRTRFCMKSEPNNTQEAPQVGAIDQHRDLRPGNVKPNAQLPNLYCLW